MKIKSLLLALLATVGSITTNAQYCTSQATSTFTGNKIGAFNFNTINTSSAPTLCENYTNNINISTNIYQGQTIPVSITGADCGTFGSAAWSAKVYIDYNADGDFLDAGEEVLAVGPATAVNSTLTGTVTVPANVPNNTTRLRVVLRNANNLALVSPCGNYTAGETEDYTVVIAPTAQFDIGIINARVGGMFTQVPVSQATLPLKATVLNPGSSTTTGGTVLMNVAPTAFNTQANVGSMLPLDRFDVTGVQNFVTPNPGNYRANFSALITQADGFPANDTFSIPFAVSDTVMSRDSDNPTGSIGGTSSIEFGQTIEVVNADTLTSVSIRLTAPTIGSRAKVYLRAWDAVNNLPGAIIDSTRTLLVASASPSWYHFKIGCGNRVLQPGKYFLGVYQVNPVNMSLSYEEKRFDDETFLYVDLLNGNGWVPSNSSSLNTLVDRITLYIRANFARYRPENVIEGGNSIPLCAGGETVLRTDNYINYTWSDGSIFDSLVVSQPGVYSVTATDALGCQFVDQVSVTSFPPIPYTENVTDASACGRKDGSATVTGTGANAPFTYMWEDGTSGPTISNVFGGSYVVSITDRLGCTREAVVNIGGKNPELNLLGQQPSCNGFGNGSIFIQMIEGAAPFTYTWSNGTSDSILTNVAAGSYALTITDKAGCSSTKSFILTNPPIINVSGANSISPSACGNNDGEAIVQVTGGVAPYNYLWSDGTQLGIRVGLFAGNYDVSVTDALGCQVVSTVTINDPNAPILQTTGSTLLCGNDANGSVSVAATGGTAPLNTLWSTGATSNSVSNLAKGVYTVRVEDAVGCISFGTAEVDGPEAISIQLGVNYFSVCNDEAFALSISGGTRPYAYQWNDPNASTTSSVSGLCNGNYKLVVTDANGCKDSAVVVLFNPTTGVAERTESSFLVYPNPAKEQIIIEHNGMLNNGVQIQIMDLSGAVVAQYAYHNFSTNQVINVAQLSAGLYFLSIDNQATKEVIPISIMR